MYKKIQIDTRHSKTKEIQEFLKLKNNENGSREYQLRAYENLTTRLLNDDDRIAGMLVLPTGGGKTRVSVSWAIDKAINDGYKVLWIAHRHMLLEQAYETFKKFAGLCKIKDNLNLKIVSGKSNHAKLMEVDFKKDDIVIASIGSMHKKMRYKFRSVKKLLIIVDEAHHSIAPTYKEWIGLPDKKNKFGWFRKQFKNKKFDKLKVLGLTATPINSNIKKEQELKAIYDGEEALFTISTATLMKKGILSQPILNRISTNSIINIDVNDIDGKTSKEKEDNINKILASNVNRNRYIVEIYEKYYKNKGKTLIFAVNKNHAEMLKSIFNSHNINSEIVYSGKKYNDKVIAEFQNEKSGLDVLININILTEGSDIPNIQNLFITRVVGSETLYTQMIGRALRGIHSGGTRDANIVTFEDNIKNFDFLSLKNLFIENGWKDSEIKEKNFREIEVINDRKYSINEIQNFLEREYDIRSEDGEVIRRYRYNLVDVEIYSDDRIREKIVKDKQSYYLIGIRDKRKTTKRWSFTKEKGQYSFKTNKKSDIKNFDRDKKLFYFIIQKQDILVPRVNQALYYQEIYEEFRKHYSSIDNIDMLPSYGKPIGEYKLFNEQDELIDVIPVFKFQANSYERFLDAYYNDKINIDLNDLKAIKKQYFSEANNFMPVNERILSNLCKHIEHNERPILEEYDFETMNEIDDTIDNLARKYASGERLNLNFEYDNHKILHNSYSRKEFRDEIMLKADIMLGYSNAPDKIKEIPFEKLNLTRFKYRDIDDFNKIHNLDELYKKASREVCKQLKIDKLKFSPPKAIWTKKAYKSYVGISRGIDVYTKIVNDDKKSLEINSILCSDDIPSYVIEFVLYHEMLHFELKSGHTKEFKKFERSFYKYEEAELILFEVADWIDAYWEDEMKLESKYEKKGDVLSYGWKIYDKKDLNVNEIKQLKLPSIEKMKKLYNDKNFQNQIIKTKKRFLCDDKKTIFSFLDGSIEKNRTIFPKKNGEKGELFYGDLHLLVQEEE